MVFFGAFLVLASLVATPLSHAEMATIPQMKKQLEALEVRVQKLEQKCSSQESGTLKVIDYKGGTVANPYGQGAQAIPTLDPETMKQLEQAKKHQQDQQEFLKQLENE